MFYTRLGILNIIWYSQYCAEHQNTTIFREIVANLKRLIAGDDPKPMNPWFKASHLYFLLMHFLVTRNGPNI